MSRVRVLISLDRNLQRLGFMKRIASRARTLGNSIGENLGQDLIDRITKKYEIAVDDNLRSYMNSRGIGNYQSIQVGERTNLELQHLYLADPLLPSGTGNLVQRDTKRYPWLATGIGLLRGGTYSLTVRGLALLHLSPEEELQAFLTYLPTHNPLLLSQPQRLLLAYTLLERDGEALALLYKRLLEDHANGFNEPDVASCLPDVYQQVIERNKRRLLSISDRERLENLAKTAGSVQEWIKTQDPNKGAWKHVVRFRLEALVDFGWLGKPDRYGYEYFVTAAGAEWVRALDFASEEQLEAFLATRFSSVAARAHYPSSVPATEAKDILVPLYKVWESLKSPQGYVPIEELALVASIGALEDSRKYFEISEAREALLQFQRANPYLIRFTVDRRGALAHVRFLGNLDEIAAAIAT